MARIGLVVRANSPEAVEVAERAKSWLGERGHEASFLGGPEDGLDLVVSLGGDGTMLRAVGIAAPMDVPVLGVNLGELGYLTEVEPQGMEAAFERFLAGEYDIEQRMMLEVTLESSGRVLGGPRLALNDVIVERLDPGHTVRLKASIAGRDFMTYAADGLLVATPTGSTAYNLSARGPIVSPRLAVMILTPVSPHMLFDRALVLDPSEEVRISVMGTRPASLAVDGQRAGTLEVGDAVLCRPSRTPAQLVVFSERQFHAILKSHFRLSDR
jgi:NAD+ kinase